MAITVQELVTKLGFVADNSVLKKYNEGVQRASKAANKMAAVMGGAGAAIVGLAKKTSDTGREIATLASEAGVSTFQLQMMQKWATKVGASQGNLQKALGRSHQRMIQASEGNEKYTNALESIGFSTEEIASGTLSSVEIFKRFQDRVEDGTMSAKDYSAAVAFYGQNTARQLKSGLEDSEGALESLREEMIRTGSYMTKEQIEAADKFGKSWDHAKETLKQLGIAIGAELMPKVQEFIDSISAWVDENGEELQDWIKGAIDRVNDIAEAFGGWGNTIKTLVGIFVGLKVIGLIAKLSMGLSALAANPVGLAIMAISAAVLALIAAITWAIQNWDKIKEAIGRFKDFAVDAAKRVAQTFKDVWQSIKDSAFGVFFQVFDFYAGIWGKIYDVTKSMAARVKEFFIGLIPDWAIAAAKKVGGVVGGIAQKITGGGGGDNASPAPDRDIARDIQTHNQSSTSKTTTVNARVDATLQVPPGTTEQQKQELKRTVDEAFERKLNAAVRGAMVDVPVTE